MPEPIASRQMHLKRVLSALNAGEDALAASLCAALLHETPGDAAARQLMATIELRARRFADAEIHVRASLTERPQHAPTWGLAGQIALAEGRLSDAAERFDRAVSLDPTREDTAFARCRVLIALAAETNGDIGGTRDLTGVITELLSRFPDFASGWAAVAGDLEKAGKLDAALVASARAANGAPSVAGFVKCAQLALNLSRATDAAAALRRALAINPDLAPVWFKLGVILQDGREFAGAVEAYHRALAIDGGLAEAMTNLGIVLQELGQLDAAKVAYGRALRIRPDSFGRIAQALTSASKGELWLDLGQLRAHLLDLAGAG